MKGAETKRIDAALVDDVPRAARADESEAALLGSFIKWPRTIDDTAHLVDADDFHDPGRQRLCAYLYAERDRLGDGESWDQTHIKQRLEQAGVLNELGGEDVLLGLCEVAVVPTAALLHAKTVHDAAEVRRARDHAAEVLRATNRADFRIADLPPPPDAETAALVACAVQYAGATVDEDEARRLVRDRTDTGSAVILARLYGSRLRFDHQRRRWLVWRGHWWQPDNNGEPRRLAIEAARWRYEHAFDLADADEAKRVATFGVKSRNRAKIDAALAVAEDLHPFADAGEGWDADPLLLGVENGVVDLRDGSLRDGRPADRITGHVPHAFKPDAECPRWRRFLAEIFDGDDDLIEHVHRALGYSASGETCEHAFWTLHGGGSNGKSVFLRTLRHVLGQDYTYDAGFSLVERHGRAQVPEDLAHLRGRRFVTASETVEGSRFNEARIKALTGEDLINARHLYGRRFNFQPEAKLWLAVNHLPRVTDDSVAFWRRARLIPFHVQFLGADDDKGLAGTLAAEAEGILAWIVQGFAAYRGGGLTLPEAVKAATAQYRSESDPLADFLAEWCDLGRDYAAAFADLYKVYVAWAADQGISERERLKRNGLGRRLNDRFERFRPDGRRVHYRGIGLRAHD